MAWFNCKIKSSTITLACLVSFGVSADILNIDKIEIIVKYAIFQQ